MAIKVTNGFEVRSKNSIDTRLTFTKEQMLTVNDKLMPEVYFTVCIDDGKFYLYKKTNEILPLIGKFRSADEELSQEVQDLLNRVTDTEQCIGIINERLETEFLAKEDLKIELPGAIVAAMQEAETKKAIEEAIAETIPGALKDALAKQADSDSGLAVDEEGNIKVQLNEEHMQIIDNKIDLAISVIQAIDGNID